MATEKVMEKDEGIQREFIPGLFHISTVHVLKQERKKNPLNYNTIEYK